MIRKYILLFLLFCFGLSSQLFAQNKAVITNLNNQDVFELKTGDLIYFGINNSKEKFSGSIEQINESGITIAGKNYRANELNWIDFKGIKPKRNNSQVARIVFYFGGALLGLGTFNYLINNDRENSELAVIAGAGISIVALAIKVLPRQPKFDFTKKHLLEIVPASGETN
jgi:hypothetical protein